MATTTRRTLRQEFEMFLHGWPTFLTTSAGAGDGSTLVCSNLAYFGDDYFNSDGSYGWLVLPTGPTNDNGSYEAHRIADFSGSTGTFTFPAGDYASAQVTSGRTCEYHRYNPALMHSALNNAGRFLASRGLYLPIQDETLIVDNRLSNADADTYSGGAFTGWTAVGSPTVTQETSIVWHGQNAFKIVSGATAGQLTQTPVININELKGRTVILRGSAWASAATVARLRLDWDGSDIENSNYHSGASQWERSSMYVLAPVPSTATQVKAIMEVAGGTKTAYFDTITLICGTVERYAVPSAFRYVSRVEQQDNWLDPWGSYVPLSMNNPPRGGHILRLIGRGALSLPTSDTATMEVGAWDMELLFHAAAKELYQALAQDATGQDRSRLSQSQLEHERERDQLLRNVGGPHLKGASRGGGRSAGSAYEVRDESGTLYLYLRR